MNEILILGLIINMALWTQYFQHFFLEIVVQKATCPLKFLTRSSSC